MKKLFVLLLMIAASALNAECPATEVVDPLHEIPEYQRVGCVHLITQLDFAMFLIQKRLAMMNEMARCRWNYGFDVDDVSEDEKLVELIEESVDAGLPREWAQTFWESQLAADRLVQSRAFEFWTEQGRGFFDHVADLGGELVPYVQELNQQLLKTVAKLYPALNPSEARCLTTQNPLSKRTNDFVPSEIWNRAIDPLKIRCS